MRLRIAFLSALVALLVAAPADATLTTFGAMSPPYSGSNGCGGCSWFQDGVSSGPSYAAPVAGTVTSFRMRIGDASTDPESAVVTVVRPLGGGQFEIVHRTAPFDLSNRPAGSVVEFPVSIPVEAGDTFGFEYSTSKFLALWVPSDGTSGDLMWQTNSIALNAPWTPSSSIAPRRLNLEITVDDGVEPPVTPPTSGGGSPTPPAADTTAPIISGLKSKYKKFKVLSGAPKSVRKGTAFQLALSEAASTKFAVQLAVKKQRKTIWKTVTAVTKALPAGSNSVKFSGKYKAGTKTKRLKAGKYRVLATATDAAGNAGTAVSAKFSVVAQ